MSRTELLKQPAIDQQAIAHASPAELDNMHPLALGTADIVSSHQQQIIDIMEGRDPRLAVMIGPCSMDNAAFEGQYGNIALAQRIQELSAKEGLADELLLVMRSPFTKPRSDLGIRGLIQKDPVVAHGIMTRIANEGLPFASEVMTAADLAMMSGRLALAWLGARNIGDTNIRHTLSAFSGLPVFCKNDGYGNITPALKAMQTIAAQHENVDVVLQDGRRGRIPLSAGNPHTGLLWRGGDNALTPESWKRGLHEAAEQGAPLGVDLSHGGSMAHDPANKKSEKGIRGAAEALTAAMIGGTLARQPSLVTFEVNLLGGADTSMQTPGKSWTDACLSIDDTPAILHQLAEAHARGK